jgi:hypothetical protein
MLKDILDNCASCHTCATGKPRNHTAYGKLKLLPVLSRDWQQIGIDFIGPLPLLSTRHGSFDLICVVIDHLSSMVHLVPSQSMY